MEVKFQVNEGSNFGNLISVHLTRGLFNLIEVWLYFACLTTLLVHQLLCVCFFLDEN